MTAVKRTASAMFAAVALMVCCLFIIGDHLWTELRKAWRKS